MKSYSERWVFSSKLVSLLEAARRFVSVVPEIVHGKEVRCHELARAVARALAPEAASLEPFRGVVGAGEAEGLLLRVCDGTYLGTVDHSWIDVSSESGTGHLPGLVVTERIVLDVYAVGALPQVQLVYQSPLVNRFHEGSQRSDIRASVVRELRWAARHEFPLPSFSTREPPGEPSRP